MSTRSRIGYENADGSITHVYCHFDGYVYGGVGEQLLNYTRSQIRLLVIQGDMSQIGKPYTSRGESLADNAPKTSANEKEFIAATNRTNGEYAYYITKRGVWKVCDLYNHINPDGKFRSLKKEFKKLSSQSRPRY